MVPISKSIWQDASAEYPQRIFIAFTTNFLNSPAKTFPGTGQSRCCQTFWSAAFRLDAFSTALKREIDIVELFYVFTTQKYKTVDN